MADDTSNKLETLETLIAHQSKEVSDLNDVVTKQAEEIDTLKKYIKIKLDKIENSLSDLGESEHKSIIEEEAANKPPHY